jgi:serine/alanine adding enzyme
MKNLFSGTTTRRWVIVFPDIYFEEEYGKLCEIIEHGKAEIFEFISNEGKIRNLYIKRNLPKELDPDQKYFDITTPYGYGGPIITELNGDKEKLLSDFDSEFSHFCIKNNIISEFVRFHPIVRNDITFSSVYDTVFMRETVATRIEGIEDPIQEEFSKSTRKSIRRSLRDGITYEIIENPYELNRFIEVYYETMDRNETGEFYYFSEEYFEYLCDYLADFFININVFYDNQCIGSGIYTIYNGIMQSHLSGTRSEFLRLSPAYVLKFASIDWAKKNNIKIVHHGGGATSDPEDSLLLFKKKFSQKEPFYFYIGKKIHNKEIYDLMVDKSKKKVAGYFPQYRG